MTRIEDNNVIAFNIPLYYTCPLPWSNTKPLYCLESLLTDKLQEVIRVKVQTRTRPMKIQTSDTKPDFLILINTKKFEVYWDI